MSASSGAGTVSYDSETGFLNVDENAVARRFPLGNSQQVRAELAKTLKGRASRLWLAIVVLIISAIAGLVPPRLIGMIIDLVESQQPFLGLKPSVTAIVVAGVIIVVAGVVGAVLSAAGFVLLAGLTDTMIARLREKVVSRGLLQPLVRVESAGAGDLVSRATVDVTMIGSAINATLGSITSAFFALAVTLLGMVFLSWQFFVVMIVLLPLYALILRRFIRRARPLYGFDRAERAARASEVLGSLRGLKAVRAYGLEEVRASRISRHSWNVVRLALLERVATNQLRRGILLAQLAGTVGLLAVGLALVQSGQVTLGEATTAVLFFTALYGPIDIVLFSSGEVMSGWASLQRVVGVIVSADEEDESKIESLNDAKKAVVLTKETTDEQTPLSAEKPPTAEEQPQGADAEPLTTKNQLKGVAEQSVSVAEQSVSVAKQRVAADGQPVSIGEQAVSIGEEPVFTDKQQLSADQQAGAQGVEVTISGVHFSFDDREVLHDIDLVLPAGKTVAMVGVSGSGKSTLASLIGGIRTPKRGSITIGGRNSSEISDSEWSRLVTLLTQEVHVFSGSLREDLTLASPTATDDDLWQALTDVGARSWIDELEHGLDTEVGAIGESLSPLQEQQLALARVALVDPPVVILDEATAEAGSTGAELLERAASRVVSGRTALVIAHRLTQAAAADWVVLLSAGQIVEQGSHSELVSVGGVYASLWNSWSRGR